MTELIVVDLHDTKCCKLVIQNLLCYTGKSSTDCYIRSFMYFSTALSFFIWSESSEKLHELHWSKVKWRAAQMLHNEMACC